MVFVCVLQLPLQMDVHGILEYDDKFAHRYVLFLSYDGIVHVCVNFSALANMIGDML